jgi:NAD(P)-dependent dehydrogenase (short-subunit alcohol dehydrogenase family)
MTGPFDLTGRVALITGAGSGMGRASAVAFGEAGAHVIVVDRDAQSADAVTAEVAAGPGSAESLVLDLTDVAAIGAAFEELTTRHDVLDVLFNHAGRVCAAGMDVSLDDWDAAVDLNLRAPVFVTQAALPLLRRSSHGASLIYTASIAGLVASPNSPIYSAVKGGVVQYARSVAVALGPEGMRANVICPGPTQTPMLRDFFGGADDAVEAFVQRVPLRRAGLPREAATLALFLASDASSYVTGVAIPADGGYVAG